MIGSLLDVPVLPSATFLATSSILPNCTSAHNLPGESLVYRNASLSFFDPKTGSSFDHGPNNGYEEASFDAGCEFSPALCPCPVICVLHPTRPEPCLLRSHLLTCSTTDR